MTLLDFDDDKSDEFHCVGGFTARLVSYYAELLNKKQSEQQQQREKPRFFSMSGRDDLPLPAKAINIVSAPVTYLLSAIKDLLKLILGVGGILYSIANPKERGEFCEFAFNALLEMIVHILLIQVVLLLTRLIF